MYTIMLGSYSLLVIKTSLIKIIHNPVEFFFTQETAFSFPLGVTYKSFYEIPCSCVHPPTTCHTKQRSFSTFPSSSLYFWGFCFLLLLKLFLPVRTFAQLGETVHNIKEVEQESRSATQQHQDQPGFEILSQNQQTKYGGRGSTGEGGIPEEAA